MPARQELLSIVAALQDALDRHDVNAIMAMFTDDAEFVLEGLARLVGKSEIRTIFEYDAGVNGHVRLINCAAKAGAVDCQMVEHNDRLRLAGLDQGLYPLCVLSFENRLIRSWRAVPDPEPTQAFIRFWGAVRMWIKEHHAAEYAHMYTPEGQFIRNRHNGERAVQLGREYLRSVAS